MNLVKKFSVFALMIATVVSMSGGLTVKAAGNYNAGSLLAKAGVSGAAVYYIGSDGMKYVTSLDSYCRNSCRFVWCKLGLKSYGCNSRLFLFKLYNG